MNRRLVPAALAVSAALLGASSSVALANSTQAAGHRLNAGPTKVKAMKAHYSLAYNDEKFGPVNCKGVHITSTQYPGTATSGGADKFVCKSVGRERLLFGSPGETLVNFTEWQSDYFATKGESVLAKSLTATISAGGKAYRGFAVYPSPEEEAQKAKEAKEAEEKAAEEKAAKEKQEQEEKEKEGEE